ncbi:MAG: hypothetical protein IKA51_05315 [Clostridia bacterium]|nr:hypothetical protein [Clostridia bacterium]
MKIQAVLFTFGQFYGITIISSVKQGGLGGGVMQNNPDVIQKAKRYVRRYKIWCTVFAMCIVLGYCLVALQGNIFATLAALVVFLLMILIGSPIVFNKCILSILNKKLDADTYLATVYQGNFDTPAALWQLYGEYFCGHYQNVISICKLKLNDPKTANRYKYHYLIYLANVYFDIGDDENLRSVCEQYEIALAKEKTSKQANCRTRFPRMTFYDLYLKQNIDACIAWVNTPTPVILNQYHRKLCKARLSLMQGNEEEANEYYEVLAKEAAHLNYGKLAIRQLAEQKNQEIDDSLQTLNVSDESADVTLYPANRRKFRKILAICLIAFVVIYAAIGILRVINSNKGSDSKTDAYHAYLENVRVLVEEDYDNVVMLEAFNLKNGEENIDAMFVCRTDEKIIVGCLYTYDGDSQQYYEKMTDISISSLSEERSPLWYCSFPSKTSHNQIESYFYTVEADVPADYVYLSTFEINGQKVYYVITEIVPGIVITMPS